MPDLPLPLTFRAEIIEPLAQSIRAGESCALVGVGSSGKSNIVRFLRDRADARQHYFGDSARRLLWLMVDCNALDAYDEPSLYGAMIDSLTRAIAARSDAGALGSTLDGLCREAVAPDGRAGAYRFLHRAVELTRQAGDFQLAFVLDDCDKLIQTAPPTLFRRLRALRDDYKYQLLYVAVTRRELHGLRPQSPEFESFFEIVVSRSFAVGPYSDHDARFMINRLASRLEMPRTLDDFEIGRLILATGGHPGLLKTSFYASRAGELAAEPDLMEMLANDSHVTDECRKIWESLEDEDRAGLIAAISGKALGGGAHTALMAMGLVRERTDGTHAIFCPLFESYVAHKAGGPPSISLPHSGGGPVFEIFPHTRLVRVDSHQINLRRIEFELLCLLLEKRGSACSREDLLERAVAAESREPSGLGNSIDGAIDQAVIELRRKIEPRGAPKPYITATPGGGYRLIGDDGR
ncbi:MAG: winged helix-turn-helix domain-containing protein [Chloroflexota bacterium]